MITLQQGKQIREYFSDQPVDAVYLFGSQTNNKANKLSDIDFAVLFQPQVNRSDRFDLRLEYMSKLGTITGFPDQTDVIDLELAPLPLKFSAIHPRRDIYISDKNRKVLFEAETMSHYFDYSYYMRQNTLISLASISKMQCNINKI